MKCLQGHPLTEIKSNQIQTDWESGQPSQETELDQNQIWIQNQKQIKTK